MPLGRRRTSWTHSSRVYLSLYKRSCNTLECSRHYHVVVVMGSAAVEGNHTHDIRINIPVWRILGHCVMTYLCTHREIWAIVFTLRNVCVSSCKSLVSITVIVRFQVQIIVSYSSYCCFVSGLIFICLPLQWPRALRRVSTAGFESSWGHWCLSFVLRVVRWKCLWWAHPSSRGALPTMVCLGKP